MTNTNKTRKTRAKAIEAEVQVPETEAEADETTAESAIEAEEVLAEPTLAEPDEEPAPIAEIEDPDAPSLRVRVNAGVLGLTTGSVVTIADTSEARLNITNGNLDLVTEG